jgi:hypothetical protein
MIVEARLAKFDTREAFDAGFGVELCHGFHLFQEFSQHRCERETAGRKTPRQPSSGRKRPTGPHPRLGDCVMPARIALEILGQPLLAVRTQPGRLD